MYGQDHGFSSKVQGVVGTQAVSEDAKKLKSDLTCGAGDIIKSVN
jgi:hypothetical protein